MGVPYKENEKKVFKQPLRAMNTELEVNITKKRVQNSKFEFLSLVPKMFK
jgi:hypothetical protein